jgi:hypothetical protein
VAPHRLATTAKSVIGVADIPNSPVQSTIGDANTCPGLHKPRSSATARLESATLFPEGRKMKALGIAAAIAVALTPFSAVATTPYAAQAAPCAGAFANPTSCENCLHLVEVYHTANVCAKPEPPRPTQTSTVPVQIPDAPPVPLAPEPALPEGPLQEPPPPSVIPVQSPSPPPPSTIAVAAHNEPSQPAQPWWPVALGYGGLATALGLVFWLISRRNGVRV